MICEDSMHPLGKHEGLHLVPPVQAPAGSRREAAGEGAGAADAVSKVFYLTYLIVI